MYQPNEYMDIYVLKFCKKGRSSLKVKLYVKSGKLEWVKYS